MAVIGREHVMKHSFVRHSASRSRGYHAGFMRSTAVALLTMPITALAASTLSVSPASITWDTNTWIQFSIDGLTAGTAVNLQLFVDTDRNGQVGTNDIQLAHFGLKDGISNSLGARIIVCDTNGAADGRIAGQISYHGLVDMAQFWHAAGAYVWRASLTNGAAITTCVFAVTQPTGSVWLTGSVNILTNVVSMTGRPASGALVIPELYSDIEGRVPAVWTDTNGNFRMDIPAGISAASLSGVTAIKPGFFTGETAADNQPLSSFFLNSPLANGANALPGPVFVVPQIPGLVPSVSGTVRDSLSNALAGVLLMIQPENDFGGMSFGISRSNGTYSIPWPGDMDNSFIMTMSPMLNMRGLMGSGVSFMSATTDIANVDLECPAATTLARVQVKKSESPGGVAGAKVNLYGEMTGAETYTFDTNGIAELCVVGTADGSAEVSNDSLRPIRRMCTVNEAYGLTVPSSGMYSGVTFTAYPGYVISGNIYDTLLNPLPGGGAYARATNQYDALDSREPDLTGHYELLVPPGTYELGTWGYSHIGYADQTMTGLVTISGAGASNMNFILSKYAVISGRVLGDGNPLPNARLEAEIITYYADDNWSAYGAGWADSDADGYYQLLVPPGTTYVIHAQGPDNSPWLDQYYSNATDASSASPVLASSESAVTNINFNLHEGARISGHVQGNGSPLEFAEVDVDTVTFQPGGGWNTYGVAWTQTDSDGYYQLTVPPGTSYTVRARGPYGSLWLEQFYDGVSDVSSATIIETAIGAPATNIDFHLEQGASISGYVLGEGNPLEFAMVQAEIVTVHPGGGWDSHAIAWSQTESNGYYQLIVPDGTACVVRAQGPYGSEWLEQYFSNTTDAATATLLSPTEASPVTGINFNLQTGCLISGTVRGDGTALEGMSVEVGTVVFDEWDNWNWERSYYGPATDSEGRFKRYVPAGTNYYVAVYSPMGSPWLGQFYSNAVDVYTARRIACAPEMPATNIDFNLQSGATISGRVLGGGEPLGFAEVMAGIIVYQPGGGWDWMPYFSFSDANGYYTITVPQGTGYTVYAAAYGEWDGQYYAYVPDAEDATPVAAFTNAPAVNIDFNLGLIPLTITTATLPTATNGAPYSIQLNASGGQQPYAWSLMPGSLLPAGLILSTNGLIHGTPSTTGVFNFAVSVATVGPFDETNRALSLVVVAAEGHTDLKWSLQLNGGPIYYSSPAIATGGTIYVGSGASFGFTATRGVYAVNTNGTLSWQYTGTNMLQMFTPAVGSNGVIYVQDVSSTLHALNTNGTLRWTYPLSRYIEVGQTAPAIADDGTIYVCAESVYAINPDGTLKWRNMQLGMSTIRNSPAIAPDGTIYVGVNEFGGALCALSPSGTIIWGCSLPGTSWAFSSPAIGADGSIYLGAETGGESNFVFAVSTNGTIKWQYVVTGGRAVRSSPAIGVDGTIYIGTKAGSGTNAELLALNPNGTLKWSYLIDQAAADIYCSPAVGEDGIIYFGAETGYLYALRPDGSLAWRYATGNGINWSSPAIANDGTVYIGNNDGKLFAIASTSRGPADSPWPKFRHDNRNTGNWKTEEPDSRPSMIVMMIPTNKLTICWPSFATGSVLQQSYALGTSNWTTSPESVSDNGTMRCIIVNSPTGRCFYRLFQP